MLGFAMMWTDDRMPGWPGTGSGAGRFATFLGLTIGTAVAMSSWTTPEAVGRRLPLSAGQPAQKWSDVDTGEIIHRGNRVTGRIDHVEFTHNWGTGNPQFRVRVSYQGTDGPRSVVTTMTTSAFQAPLVGNTVDVLYAPETTSRSSCRHGPTRPRDVHCHGHATPVTGSPEPCG